MHYERTNCAERLEPCEHEAVHEVSLTDMQKKATMLAEEIYLMVNRLGYHFFGVPVDNREEKPSAPECLRNDIYWQLQTLGATHESLMSMFKEIGV